MDFLRLSVLSEFSPFYISFLFPGRPAHVPNCHRYAEKIPNGCFIKPDKALLARSRNNAISQDPVLNFFFATTAISYILPSLLMILMAILLRTTRWTQVCVAKLQNCKDFGEKKTLAAHQDGKLNRFYKLAIALCVLFIATKSPVEISSFIDLIHTNQLFAIVNKRPDELGQHRHTYFEKTKHFF